MLTANLAQFRRRLLGWYEKNHRDLPWRRTSDPYAIWVSETMLQQTQVATVIPYYRRFMRAFPTIEALHRAPLGKVLALWSGLGYYRRAENLKKSARIVMKRHRRQLPADYEALRELPGVGEYTAGALLSIAFGQPYAAIDGNARRVLARALLVVDETELRGIARRLLSRSKPGAFNQSLMELGSKVCTPANPRCGVCPLASLCAAQKSQTTQTRVSKKRVQAQTVVWPLVIVRQNGKLLLQRRPAGGVLAGLWELPGGEKKKTSALQSVLKECLPDLHPRPALCLGDVSHNITYRRIRAPVFLLDLASAPKVRFDGGHRRWITPAELDRQPTSAMTRKAIRLLTDYEKSLF